MATQRRQYTAEFKAKVVLEVSVNYYPPLTFSRVAFSSPEAS